ncbi:uncharacterized protein C8A04DRAFT_37563 [Dichotomopilus funicola]|uniref:Bromo domain-containing protein n=1 Tax=Dichotomopilus funicola TaxID=1934379 RepID=A0AAN6V3I0_9PEZI|nr:hypothetical protein C8A04DRAFT_37563 [Dichotomopilus funicola]
MSDEATHQANGQTDANVASKTDKLDDAGAEVPSTVEPSQPFSWLQPHPIFVIALVGPDETPFGIQKDFLCSRSTFYKKHFDETPDEGLENLVRLPNTSVEVFAYAQNFLYTGTVFPALDKLPSYDILIGVWKLGHDLGIDGLCDAALEAMIECRRVTQHIPATPLLVQVWKETPEGSSIRRLLLTWTAEYMRSSETRAEFARSLPQEVLSELVVAMSSLNLPPLQLDGDSTVPTSQRRSVPHDLAEPDRPAKKRRTSEAGISTGGVVAPIGQLGRKPGPRASLPGSKPGPKPGSKRRASAALSAAQNFSANQKLNFCADLLSRMLSGPGFWTRVVGPFKDPVDPERDGVPDYLNVVKKPMDLMTMKAKMDGREYTDENEFLADMNQIFTNCYTYWREQDPMWTACEKLQKSFEDKFGQMNKWIAKMEGDEGH